MPEVAAVVEAPEIGAVETPEIEPSTPETPVVTEPSAEEPTTQEPAQKDDGRQFAGKMRDLHKQLSASQDPADQRAAKQLKELFFANKALHDKFPGGLKEVEELASSYQKYGTPEQIEEAKQAAEAMEQLDSKWMAADPTFIDELATLNTDSFKKLVPVALNKYAQVDPEGYQRTLSGILSATLSQAKMGDQLYLISRELQRGDTAEALNLIKQIQDWMGELDKSGKAPATPAADPRNTEFEQRAAQLEEQKAEFFNQQLATEVNSWRDGQIKTALAKLTNGARIDPERLEIFNDRVTRELVKMQPADFKDKWLRLYAQGDKAALVKFVQGFEGAAITKAVSKVHSLLFPSNGVKKAPVTAPAQQPTTTPAETGWVKIPQRPKPDQIARGRNQTSDEMILSGKAILRDGRKVMWDRA